MSAVLIVEDDASVRAVIVNSLEPMGYLIIEAATTEEALRQIRDRGERIDLLDADVHLPRLSGLSVARQLRSFRADVPLVLTSGHTPDFWNQDELAILGGIESANIDYLPKPFTGPTLRSVVSHALVRCRPDALRAGASA